MIFRIFIVSCEEMNEKINDGASAQRLYKPNYFVGIHKYIFPLFPYPFRYLGLL